MMALLLINQESIKCQITVSQESIKSQLKDCAQAVGRKGLAALLLEHETCAAEQVPNLTRLPKTILASNYKGSQSIVNNFKIQHRQ